MMVMSPIDESAYDEAATQITYCKLFPLIIEDFVTRMDAKQMMMPSNLPFKSDVVVIPGQVVQVVPSSGTGATSAPGKGTGAGTVKPIYNGSTKHPSNGPLVAQKKVIKDAGGQTTDAILNTALGE